MRLGLVLVTLGVLLGLSILVMVAYGGYLLVEKLAEFRRKEPNYESQIKGIGNFPVDLASEEEVLFDSRGRDIDWKVTLKLGGLVIVFSILSVVFLFAAYWGRLLVLSAYKMKTNPEYIFTTDRLIQIQAGGNVREYEYDDVQQLQTGAAGYERVLNVGHLEFSTGEAHQLHRIPVIRDHTHLAQRLEDGIPS